MFSIASQKYKDGHVENQYSHVLPKHVAGHRSGVGMVVSVGLGDGIGVGFGDGRGVADGTDDAEGTGDGGDDMKSPPQAQHISSAVKSSSL